MVVKTLRSALIACYTVWGNIDDMSITIKQVDSLYNNFDYLTLSFC